MWYDEKNDSDEKDVHFSVQVCFFIFGYFLPLFLIICLYSIMIRRLLTQVVI